MIMSEAEQVAQFLVDGGEALEKMREHGRATALGFNAPVSLFEDQEYDYAPAVVVFMKLGFEVSSGGEHDGETLHRVELPPTWTICLDDENTVYIASCVVEPHGVSLLRRVDIMGPLEEGGPITLTALRRYELFQSTKSRLGVGVVEIIDRAEKRIIRRWLFQFHPGEPGIQQAFVEVNAMEPAKAEARAWMEATYSRWNDPRAYWPG